MVGLLGWKTIAGTIAIASGRALQQLQEPAFMPLIGHGLEYLGILLAGVGIAHKEAKILKAVNGGKAEKKDEK